MGEARTKGPLDWVRTDDENMWQGIYIQLLTRGLYPVLEALHKAIEYEAEACATQKVKHHPGWMLDADFCRKASEMIAEVQRSLESEWNANHGDQESEVPRASLRKEPVVGAFYPLPSGGIYIPKG